MILFKFYRIKAYLNNISIKTKLLLSFFILIFIPLFILTMLSSTRVSTVMKDNMLRAAQKALTQSTTYLQTRLNNITNDTDIIYSNTTLQDVLSSNQTDEDLLQQSVDQNNLRTLINELEKNSDIYRIRLYIRDVPGYFFDQINFFTLSDLDSLPWYKRLDSSKRMVTFIPSDYFNKEDNRGVKIISASRRIMTRKYNVTDGIIRIDIRESIINDIVNQANASRTGLSYIVNQNGEIISSAGNLTILQNPKLQEFVESDSLVSDVPNSVTIDKKTFLIIFKEVANSDWKFISVIPYSEIKATGKDIRYYMLLLLIITGLISYMVAYFLSKSSTSRLRLLAKSIKVVTSGDFNIRIKESSNDEIGQISHDFNFMVKEMSEMINERFETGKNIKSLELRSLQSQINPHFLYNSLDMINWAAEGNGNTEIVVMVQALSRFYKLGLSKGKEIVSIKNEIEHVVAYVFVQNLRFENQIKLETDIDEELYSYGISKITLQPIVENSIQHGICKKKIKSGTIWISAKRTEEIITFEVRDDGIGMSEQIVKNLLNKESLDEFHGFGIKNVNERIKLHYGYQYGLSYESSPGMGTTVKIMIPAEKLI